jgi:hypothetical protein
MTTDFYDPFSFAFFVTVSALAAAFAVRWGKAFLKEKKILFAAGVLASFAAGLLIPVIFSGSPSAFLEAKKDAGNYRILCEND